MPAENSERGEKFRVLASAAVVSPAWRPDELPGSPEAQTPGRLIRSATFDGDLPFGAVSDIATDVAAVIQ